MRRCHPGENVSLLKVLAALTLAACLALAGCGLSTSTIPDEHTIRVGASPTPHAEILAQVEQALADEGYELEVVEYNDYMIPNLALDAGELDANYFQHITYMNDFNAENETNLASAAAIHAEPVGLYAGRTSSLDDLQDGAVIAVPNDPTNEARALFLLEETGLISLDPAVGAIATAVDIVDNPKNLQIKEVEAAQIPRVLPDVDMAVINGNFAKDAGLVLEDSVARESADSDKLVEYYANIIAVRAGTEDSDKTKALVKAMTSDAVRNYIESTYTDGSVIPVF